MQALRKASFLARLVLAWFALSLGVAAASPLVKPVGAEWVCSGVGALKLLVQNSDADPSPGTHAMDCPLCAAVAAPASQLAGEPLLAPVQAHALAPTTPFAPDTAPPLPARGPPLRLSI
jgi:hypothetical protein